MSKDKQEMSIAEYNELMMDKALEMLLNAKYRLDIAERGIKKARGDIDNAVGQLAERKKDNV